MKLVTAAQMRAMDQKTFDDYGVPSIVLMENAALAVTEAIKNRYAPLGGKRVVIVCGKGNNGGDGLAIARHWLTRFGAEVTVVLANSPDGLAGDARRNWEMAQKFGVSMCPASDAPNVLAHADLVVDALLGTGIRGGVTGPLAKLIDQINAANCPVVAVDVPSGLDADTGRVEGACVRAALTVTLALAKIGLLDFPGAEYVGELIVANIGMPPAVLQADDVRVVLTEAADTARWLPARQEGRDSNKGTFGAAILFAGSRGFVGASVLCAEAAARTGAGLVTLAVPQDAQPVVMSRANPVIMTRGLPQTPHGAFSEDALDEALALAKKGKAAGLGPGLGGQSDPSTRVFVRGFVAQCPVPLVLDADALNILSLEDDRGASLVQSRTAPTVLTPHPGEMGRLLGMETKAIQSDRRGAVERASQTFGCIALLKGARTLIATPDGQLFLNPTGNAGMASGGMGDALTGILTALLAGGLEPVHAAAASAFLHGLAGDLAAQVQGGKAGLIATDLIEALPRAIGQCQQEAHSWHVS